MARFFKRFHGRQFPSFTSFDYLAFADKDVDTTDPDARVPYARIEGYHHYADYSPSFAQQPRLVAKGRDPQPDWGGTHAAFRNHAYNRIAQASYDRALTDQEKDALDAIRVTKRFPVEGGRDSKWANEQFKTNPHLIPDQLFFETKPAKTHIESMFSDPSMTNAAMTLAGTAYRDFAHAPIEADANLSHHSSKLVQGAIKRGLPLTTSDDNHEAKKTNDIEMVPLTMGPDFAQSTISRYQFQEMDPAEVASSRQTVRDMLRGRETRTSKPVPRTNLSQQFLPGMEDFV